MDHQKLILDKLTGILAVTDNKSAQLLDLVEKHQDYVGTYYHLGKLYELLQKPNQALEIYEKGIETAKRIKDQHALNELLGVYNSLLDEMEE